MMGRERDAVALHRALERSGSPGRARTADLVINSHPLYRLSYRGIIERRMVATQRGAGQIKSHS